MGSSTHPQAQGVPRPSIIALIDGLLDARLVVGLVSMPDVYTQLHASPKAGFLGVALLLLSSAVQGLSLIHI